MSYFADHLAWQQRVNAEFKANCHHTDEELDPSTRTRFSQYPDMLNYMMITQKSHNKDQRRTMQASDWNQFNTMRQYEKEISAQGPFNGSFYQTKRGHTASSSGMQGVLGQANYTYASRVHRPQRTQSAAGSARREYKNARALASGNRIVDNISQASHKSGFMGQRMKSVASKQNSIFGQQVKQERFNEQLETHSTVSKQKAHNMLSQKNLANFTKDRPSLKVIGTPNLNATRSQISERRDIFSAGPSSRFSQANNDQSEVGARFSQPEHHKRRIIDVVNQLSPDELEKVSEMLRNSDVFDKQRVADNANPRASMDFSNQDNVEDNGEAKDQVDELKCKVAAADDEKLSSVSRARSDASKSVVASLSKQLMEERDARLKLEHELRALQTMSGEIQNRLQTPAQ